jgi:hypothetical protein
MSSIAASVLVLNFLEMIGNSCNVGAPNPTFLDLDERVTDQKDAYFGGK